jgi:hypothetical protein
VGLAKEGTKIEQGYRSACFVSYSGEGDITGTNKGIKWEASTYFKIGHLKDERDTVKFFFNGQLQGTTKIPSDVGEFRLVVDLDNPGSSATLLENLHF